jgi:uncharacterized repeat protein (TIGR04138 family)
VQFVDFDIAVGKILGEDKRYARDAYVFVREALDFTAGTLGRPADGPTKHITGQELLEGIRQYALKDMGPMARLALNTMGINRTDDFGEIVFNLVNKGALGKSESDKKEDFANGYDFVEAFDKPFLPTMSSKTEENQGLPLDRDVE